jgi:ankyrin repeat protein
MGGAMGTLPLTHQILDTAIMSVDPRAQSLFEAIEAVNSDRVKYLIESGVSVNSPNDLNQTPLAVALKRGNMAIVDLLVAAGAQTQAPKAPNLSAPISSNLETNAPDSLKAPVGNRQISYEDLIDLIHQPNADINATEIESPISISQRENTNLSNFASANDLQIADPETIYTSSSDRSPDFGVDSEQTFTYDLDAIFAQKDRIAPPIDPNISPEKFSDESTITSFSPPSRKSIELGASETITFDLSPELERLTTGRSEEIIDRLSMPMGAWDEGETYAIDLDRLDPQLGSETEEIDRAGIVDVSRLLLVDDDRFTLRDVCEDGETYAIDLDDLDSEGIFASNVAVKSERHLLSDLDSSLFPAIAGEDGVEEDPDTQTSTDIFGQQGSISTENADVTPIDNEHATNTSLMAAIIDGDLELAKQAIMAGASLDRYDWTLNYSPLGMAIDRGHAEIVHCLLAAGANPHCGSVTTTALGLAAERGEAEIIQMLLPRGIDVNEPVGPDSWTALLSAIKCGHKAVVQLLVTAGANVNVWSQNETPILLAAKCEERDIYNYLYPLVNTSIRLYADRDGEQLLQATRKRRIRQQNRPVEKFITMATEGNVEEVNRAIELGVEIDEIGALGHTALMAATYYGHRSIVRTLLAAGANPNLLSDDDGLGAGMTALMMAAGSFFASNRQAICKLLIGGGADVNQQGAGGKTALAYAALAGSGYRDCVETLISAGANLNLHDDRGYTVLTLVAAAENYQILNILIQAGASTSGLESVQLIQAATAGNLDRVRSLLAGKVNLDLERGAAIGNAAAAGHTQIVELLIQAGANVNLSNRAGFTPIASAAYAGHGEIVQLLIDANADVQAPANESHCYSALEYAQMGLYQLASEELQHAQIIRMLEQLETR